MVNQSGTAHHVRARIPSRANNVAATTPKVENTAAVPLAVSTDVPKRVVETMWKYTGSKGAHDPPLEK